MGTALCAFAPPYDTAAATHAVSSPAPVRNCAQGGERQCRLENELSPHISSLRGARDNTAKQICAGDEQSRIPPWKDSGLLRCARNDDVERGAHLTAHHRVAFAIPAQRRNARSKFTRIVGGRVSPGSLSARGRDALRSSGGRECARNWCTEVPSPRARQERDTAGT